MVTSYGTSALVDFNRLKQSFRTSYDYRGMTCSCYCIMLNLLRDWVYRSIHGAYQQDAFVKERNLYGLLLKINPLLDEPFTYIKEIKDLSDYYSVVDNPHVCKSTISFDIFYSYIGVLDMFMSWYVHNVDIRYLVSLCKDFTDKKMVIRKNRNKRLREEISSKLGIESLQSLYITYLKTMGDFQLAVSSTRLNPMSCP